ncbi:xylanase deacetylase [Gordoniibacillus kamchatkensis]|uniref:Xylanase deacetylase n=1 Tax=Gordoniibacillus kamchatkensis TaxID=1590651 RepID=A0ABR5AB09_9BACL|nr:polysaccharide deacetylase family protein [Paenibacillus sp. VKM B-2647]KIL38209.1 xylanase deacetylase [Paenibacillus sp. VKM B-2647]
MKKAFATLAATAILVSACGAAPGKPDAAAPKTTSPAAPAPSGQTAAPAPGGSPQPAPVPSAPAGAQTSAPTPVSGQSGAEASKADAEIKKDYHMNKNYDIVPNDPNGNKKVVLLTFDDGPKEKEMIDSLLDTLDKHKAKAIFFMNGYRIKAHPELLKLIDQRGGIIGNHSWDHIDLKKENSAKIDQQVDDVIKIMQDTVGKKPQFFRPPFGSGNDYLREKVKKEGMLYMTWSNGSLDWDMTMKKNDPDKVVKNVLDQLHNGSNILMHELPWTCEALDKLLTQLEEKGYSFVDPRAIELEMK